MDISLHDARRVLAVAGLMLGVYAAPATALPASNLRVYADGFLYDSGVGVSGPFQENTAATGPVQADAAAGLVLAYPYPGYEGILPDLETTLYTRSTSRADFGINGAAIELNLRAVTGTDRGTYPSGTFSGSLPINSTIMPHASAQSSWTDTFVITGGTGLGTGSVDVALHGHAQTNYGSNGDIWYGNPSFETFGTTGSGSAQYSLDIRYDAPPTGAPPEYEFGEYDQPIRWEQGFSPPLPGSVAEIGVQPDILTGSFLFEYGVPFSLSSYLTVTGYNQIKVDFNHTATLSLFDLPDGASLASGSGHLYPVSGVQVPEPSTVWLLGTGLLGLIAFARKKKWLWKMNAGRRDTYQGFVQ